MTTSSGELACIELVELVTEYLDDALPASERERIERHLGECDGCDRYVEQIRQTIRAAGRLAPEDMPSPVLDRLLTVFRESRSRRPDD
jgi:anti-sigma factor RsiW